MNFLTCCLALLLLTLRASAQLQPMPKLFEAEKMDVVGTRVYLNGKKLKLKELEPYLNKFPDAAAEYQTFLRQRTKIRIFQGISLLPSLLVISSSETLSWSGLVATTSLELISIPLNTRARKHLRRSVQLYNERSLHEFLYK